MQRIKSFLKPFLFLTFSIILTACASTPPPQPLPVLKPIQVEKYEVSIKQFNTKPKDLIELANFLSDKIGLETNLTPATWKIKINKATPILLLVNYTGKDGLEYVYTVGFGGKYKEISLYFDDFRDSSLFNIGLY